MALVLDGEVGLPDGAVGHLDGVQVLGVNRHPCYAGPEDAILGEPAELAGVLLSLSSIIIIDPKYIS